MRRVAGVLVAFAAVVALASPVWAAPADLANSIAANVMSPFCPGSTLHDCPSAEAQDLRDAILARAEDGWSRGRIMSWLEDEYGPSIRSTPEASGAGLIAWLLPLGIVIAGAAIAFAFLRRSTGGASDGAGVRISGREKDEVERELGALRGRS